MMNNINDKLIELPLHFEPELYTNIFKDKNNKTLQETISTSIYNSLSDMVKQNYSEDLESNLGDFLLKLKVLNDEFYKEFLNKYGDLEYSIFSLKDKNQDTLKGVYFYYLNNELKYIGRCRDSMKKRVNSGYGKISPKKCFKDGQSTNCKINSLLTKYKESIVLKLFVLSDNKQIEELESRLILENEPIWNSRK